MSHSRQPAESAHEGSDGKPPATQHQDLHSNLVAEGYPQQPRVYTDAKGEVHNRDVEDVMGTQSQFVAHALRDMAKKYGSADPDKIFHGIAQEANTLFHHSSAHKQAEYRSVLGFDKDAVVNADTIYAKQMEDRRATLKVADPSDPKQLLQAYLKDQYVHAGIDYN